MQVQILSRSHPFVIRLFLACLAWSWVHEYIVVVDAEEAEVVEEELVELVTDPIDEDNNRWKSLMAMQRVFLTPEFEEVGSSLEVVWPLSDMEVKTEIKEMWFQISFVNTECL